MPPQSRGFTPAERRVLAYCALFFIAQAATVLTGLSDGDFVCDDAFYYFQIARNAALGHGFTFDGLHPTNGFHPLFGWICVVIFRIGIHSMWGPVRAALIFLALAAAATGWVLYRLGRALGSPSMGELAAGFFFLSPFTWLLPLRGCEGGLSVLLLATVGWQMARMVGPAGFSRREIILLGALTGLAGLARTENILFGIPVFVWLCIQTRSLRAIVEFSAMALAVVSPWLIWNLATFGTIVQVSGAAKHALDLYGRMPAVTSLPSAGQNLAHVFEHVTKFAVGDENGGGRNAAHLLKAQAALIVLSALGTRRLCPHRAVTPFYGFAALHLAFNALYMHTYYNWYFLPLVLVGAIFQADRLAHVRFRWVAPLLLASTVVTVWSVRLYLRTAGYRPNYPQHLVESFLSPLRPVAASGDRVGQWNTGELGYFGAFYVPTLHIVNIDCLVNNPLFEAYKEGRYLDYLTNGLDWIAPMSYYSLRGFVGAPATERFVRQHLISLHGDWHTQRVVSDPLAPKYQGAAPPPDAVVVDDFESGSYSGWTPAGDAFGTEAAWPRNEARPVVAGFRGHRLVDSSAARGQQAMGTLTSSAFVIGRPVLRFRMSGSNEEQQSPDAAHLLARLLVDGKEVRRMVAPPGNWLEPVEWDVRDLMGKTAVVQLVDASPSAYLLVDDIYFP